MDVEERRERRRVEVDALAQFETRHHLILGVALVGNAVDDGLSNPAEPREDPLDGCSSEVLAVDTNPVGRATGEPEDPRFIAIREIARPVPAVPAPIVAGIGVVVVPLEPFERVAADQLADRLVAVHQLAGVVEQRCRALLTCHRVEHHDVVTLGGDAQRAAADPGAGRRMMAFSLEPYPANTGQLNRRLNSTMSVADDSGPSTSFNGLSASSGRSGVAST